MKGEGMANRNVRPAGKQRRSQQRRPAAGSPDPARRGGVWWRSRRVAALATVALVLVALGGFFLLRGGGSAAVAPALAAEAQANSGGPVRVLNGVHTVFHSELPLPSAAAPRSDGRYTVVWFSGTWCEFCAQMQSYANDSAAKFRDRLVFMEKSVDDDASDASRFHVRGTPTFVVLDAHGNEVSRFGFQTTAAAFEALLAQVPKPQG